MAIDYVRNIISSGYNLAKINDNFQKIQTALQDGLSRSGQGPNQMNADLDLNGYDLINAGSIDVTNFSFEGIDFAELIADAEAAAVASQASAVTATTQAGVASTQASNASSSANAAAISAANAAASVQPTLAAAANKASPTDTDRISILDAASSLALKYITIPNLIGSIFNGVRSIANAQFASATFKLLNASSIAALFNTTSLTADRTYTLPDRNITLGMVLVSSGAIPFNAAVDLAIPAGIRRATLLLNGYSTNGTAAPMIQLKAAGVAETTGYSGAVSNSAATGGTANSSGVGLNTGNAAALNYDFKIDIVLQSGNSWGVFVTGANSGAVNITGASSKTLAATLDGIRLRSSNGTDLPDAGTYALYVEY